MSSRILMIRSPSAGSEEDAEVVDEFVRGPQVLRAGAELWSLIQPDRARRIDALISRIHEHDDLSADRAILEALSHEIAGVYDAVRDALTELGTRNLEQLTSALPSFAAIWRPDAGSLASDLEAAAASVDNLRRFLQRAAEQDLLVTLSY